MKGNHSLASSRSALNEKACLWDLSVFSAIFQGPELPAVLVWGAALCHQWLVAAETGAVEMVGAEGVAGAGRLGCPQSPGRRLPRSLAQGGTARPASAAQTVAFLCCTDMHMMMPQGRAHAIHNAS